MELTSNAHMPKRMNIMFGQDWLAHVSVDQILSLWRLSWYGSTHDCVCAPSSNEKHRVCNQGDDQPGHEEVKAADT